MNNDTKVKTDISDKEWEKYYAKHFCCSNCGAHFTKWILRGVKVKDCVITCPVCEVAV